MPEVSDPITEAALVAVLACLRAFLPADCRRHGNAAPELSPDDSARELHRLRLAIHDRTLQRLGALGWLVERILGEQGEAVATEARAIADELRALVQGTGSEQAPGGDLGDSIRELLQAQRDHGVPLHLILRDDTTWRVLRPPTTTTTPAT